MFKRLRRLATGLATSARVEGLESRSLLSGAPVDDVNALPPTPASDGPDVTGPMIVKEQLIGSDPRKVDGVIITFNEALDEVSAETLKHYRIGVRTDRQQRFLDDPNHNDNHGSTNGVIHFESATYDPATFSVTLVPEKPFNITRKFRQIRVLGRQNLAVRDLAGNAIDGDGDGRPGKDSIEKYTFSRGANVSYGELDGDNVTLKLTGPGRIWVIRNTRGGRVLARGDALRVYIEDARPDRSVVTGKVIAHGNGIATIDELVNTGTADVRILTDPAFQITRAIT